MGYNYLIEEKTLWEKEKLLDTSNFFFSHNVSKSCLLLMLQNEYSWTKGLNRFQYHFTCIAAISEHIHAFLEFLLNQFSAQYSFQGTGKVQALRIGGRCFGVIATGFIPLSLLTIVSTMVMRESFHKQQITRTV